LARLLVEEQNLADNGFHGLFTERLGMRKGGSSPSRLKELFGKRCHKHDGDSEAPQDVVDGIEA
jgi:hypothetical protein